MDGLLRFPESAVVPTCVLELLVVERESFVVRGMASRLSKERRIFVHERQRPRVRLTHVERFQILTPPPESPPTLIGVYRWPGWTAIIPTPSNPPLLAELRCSSSCTLIFDGLSLVFWRFEPTDVPKEKPAALPRNDSKRRFSGGQ